MGIIYTQATSGIPAVLQHLLVNMPALHEVAVLLTVRIIPRPYASQEERFLVRRSKSLAGIFRVIVRCVCVHVFELRVLWVGRWWSGFSELSVC